MRDTQVDIWLVLTTQVALEKAGLGDLMVDLNQRVIHRPRTPMRELVLLEIRDLARTGHLTDDLRRWRYQETLRLAGY